MHKIWWRESKQAYYLQIDRTHQKRLGKTKAEADEAYRRWLIEEGQSPTAHAKQRISVAEIGQEFLDHCRKNTKPKSYDFYRYFCVPFVERFGSAMAATYSPLAFAKWLDEHGGWKSCRRNAIIAVKRMFNWAVEEAKLLDVNPLKGVKRPAKKKRKRFLEVAERALIHASIKDAAFRDFIFAMFETGCRPSEIMGVTAQHVSRDCTRWILSEHKTDGDGEDRIIYLNPAMQELSRTLIARHPDGPLFRMARGKKSKANCGNRAVRGVCGPWTYNAVRCRFKRLRQQHPELAGVTSYTLRRTYATQALLNGLPVPVVSALLGHKSIRMVDEHYNITDQVTEQLRQAASKATNANA